MNIAALKSTVARLGLFAVLAWGLLGWAAPADAQRRAPGRDNPEAVEVELFDAMEAEEIEVKVIAKNAKQANVLITNKTDKPLKIALPEAFAAVPALAQFCGGGGFGGGGLGGGGLCGGGGGGGNQGLGGGFGGGGGGLGGGGLGGGGFGGGGFGGGGFGGGGFFHVAPEKTGKIPVFTVCLEHGKDDPKPQIPYTLIPLNEYQDDPRVHEICAMLGRGEIDQASAQAAAWHVIEKMSFQALAAKVGVRHLNGTTEPFFTPQQIVRAARIVQEADRRAELRSAAEKGKSESLSQQ